MFSAGRAIAAFLFVLAAPVGAAPQTIIEGETAVISFDPPLGEPLRYRWEQSDQRDGKTSLSWSVDDYTFEEEPDGYRLTVVPVSSGSNDTDPETIAFMKLIADLTRSPFVVHISSETEIIGVEREDEYWARILAATKDALSGKVKRPEQARALEGMISSFENMPKQTKRAQLTRSVQPLLDLALTETTIGEPIATEIESESPFGKGSIKRQVTISLVRVDSDFAHLTVRTTTPGPEIERITTQLLERMGVGLNDPNDAEKRDAAMAAIRQMKFEAIANYKIGLGNGMLESYQSTEDFSVTVEGKTTTRVRTRSLTQVH